jgi:hypothetical protein
MRKGISSIAAAAPNGPGSNGAGLPACAGDRVGSCRKPLQEHCHARIPILEAEDRLPHTRLEPIPAFQTGGEVRKFAAEFRKRHPHLSFHSRRQASKGSVKRAAVSKIWSTACRPRRTASPTMVGGGSAWQSSSICRRRLLIGSRPLSLPGSANISSSANFRVRSLEDSVFTVGSGSSSARVKLAAGRAGPARCRSSAPENAPPTPNRPPARRVVSSAEATL